MSTDTQVSKILIDSANSLSAIVKLAKDATHTLAKKATEYYLNKGMNELNKNLHQVKVQE